MAAKATLPLLALLLTAVACDRPPANWKPRPLPLLEPSVADAEAQAIRDTFMPKRELMLRRLSAMGIRIDAAARRRPGQAVDRRRLPPRGAGHAQGPGEPACSLER